MKKYGFLIALAIMFSFLTNASAISMVTFKASTDKDTFKEGETFDLKIYTESEGDLSPDTTAFHVDYDLDIFEFVSYDGKANTSYDELERYIYLEDGTELTPVGTDELVGTLKLKVKDGVKDNASDILYETTYETVLNNGSIKINITDKNGNNVVDQTNNNDNNKNDDNNENTNDVSKENDNDSNTNTILIYLSIFLTLITISSTLTTIYVIRKNKIVQ